MTIAIVGAGPIGLYTAIRLKQLGIDDFILLDARANYTRPGALDEDVFTEMEKLLGIKIDYSSAKHIKDLENSLAKIAKSLGVNIVEGKFVDLAQGGIQIVDDTRKAETIRCNYIFDCTGSKRAVIQNVNEKQSTTFEITPIAENPIKNNFIAYIKMHPDDIPFLSNPLANITDPLYRALALENLRRLGWEEFDSPDVYFHSLGKDKICLYFEIPNNLKREQEEEWLIALLQFMTGKEDIHFSYLKESSKGRKPRFISFKVDPHRVMPNILKVDDFQVTVIPIGDAQIEPDYRLGMGILSGMERANALLQAIRMEEGKLHVNSSQYAENLQEIIKKHEEKIKEFYEKRKNKLASALSEEKDIYLDAQALTESVEQDVILKKGLEEMNLRLGLKLYQDSLFAIKSCLDEKNDIKLDAKNNILNQMRLGMNITNLLNALRLIPLSKLEEKQMVEKTLIELADKHEELGKKFKSLNKLSNSQYCLESALSIYKNIKSKKLNMRIVEVYLNLAILFNKKSDFHSSKEMINKAIKLLSKTKSKDKEKFLVSLKVAKLSGVLKKYNTLERKEDGKAKFAHVLNQSLSLFHEIEKSKYLSQEKKNKLEKKMNTLSEKCKDSKILPPSYKM